MKLFSYVEKGMKLR